jgi:hypothetical protein
VSKDFAALRCLFAMTALASCGAGAARERVAPSSPPATARTNAAASGAAYAIDHHTIDNGGGTAIGGMFSIRGTIGQPDADPLQPSTGGTFELTGGFWFVTSIDALFADGFEPP